MSGLVESILDLTRIEADTLIPAEKPISINEQVRDVVALLKGKAEAKGLQLTAETDGLPTELLGDPRHLRTALLHYTENAIRFTEAGSVTIRVKVVSQDTTGALLHFEVEDTGIGIAPEVLPRLFTLFEQADNSSTRKYGGAGLGLFITRKIAQRMGGDAGGQSTLGQGSTFWFTASLKKQRS